MTIGPFEGRRVGIMFWANDELMVQLPGQTVWRSLKDAVSCGYIIEPDAERISLFALESLLDE